MRERVTFYDYLDQELADFPTTPTKEAAVGAIQAIKCGGPVEPYWREEGGGGPLLFLNIFSVSREYGGPEEGGWWYDAFWPEESYRFNSEEDALRAYHAWMRYRAFRAAWDYRWAHAWVAELDSKEGEHHDNYSPWE